MLRLALVCLVAAVLALGVLACGDDDDTSEPTGSGDATPTETFGDGRTSAPTASDDSSDNGSDDGDDKTAPPTSGEDGQDDGEETPAPTAPGPTPVPPPPASEGTPAPEVPSSIVAEYAGQEILNHDCQYSVSARQVICGERGTYAINPPLVGQDITCTLWLIQDVPTLINCSTVTPFNNHYYDIAE